MADRTLLELDRSRDLLRPSQVLFGLSLAIAPGEMVTLMGRNGMGKTTTVRSIMGLTPARAGSIRFGGRNPRACRPIAWRKLGVGLVPEGRQIFPNLDGARNLVATAANRAARRALDARQVCDLFPAPRERSAAWATLSGGEQQMLAIGRALMTNPRLLILDEATEGLAPLIREESGAACAAASAGSRSW
jgi:branched-chain amino acid transport system ATP-binding protein